MPITATSRFDIETMSLAREWHWRTFGLVQWLWPIFGAQLLAVGIWLLLATEGHTAVAIWCMVFGGWCVLRKWVSGIRHRRGIRKNRSYNEIIHWELDEKGMKAKGEGSTLSMEWPLILKTCTTPDGILVYVQKDIYFWLPRQGFSTDEDFQTARELVRTHTKHRELA